MPESDDISGFEIGKYWGLVLGKKYLVISVALAVLTACTVFSFMGSAVYEAKCTVFVQRNTMVDPLVKGGSNMGSVDVQLRTLTERINSPSFLERVLIRLDPANKTLEKPKIEALVGRLQKNLTVTVKGGNKEADLFVIAFKGTTPTQTRDTVNTLAYQYIDENVESNKADASGAIEFLQTQLAEYQAKLEATDKELASYSVSPVAAAPVAHTKESRLNELNNRLAALLSQYTENHPDVLRTKSEIEAVKKLPAQRFPGAQAPRATVSKLERDRAAYQKTYDNLLQRLDNAKLSRNLQLTDSAAALKVADPAPLPTAPVKRNRVLIILAGFFLGAAAGVGAALAVDYLNPSFRDEDSVEAGLKLPVLVTIPAIVTEADLLAGEKRDRKVYIAAAAYISVILLLLVREVLAVYLGINIGGF
jgi:polysaccharide biosynthesis transport protein